MDLFITVDTEVWPSRRVDWPHTPLRETELCPLELDAYFLGKIGQQQMALPFMLETFRMYQLKATFFVDPLFSFALGIDWLRDVIRMIKEHDQGLALHLHPEWLSDPRMPKSFPPFRGPRLFDYSVAEQKMLLAIGQERLRTAGGDPATAFRAGSWCADVSTLAALRESGIRVDASLNAASSNSFPSLRQRLELLEPTILDGVIELPVTRFNDRISPHGRPLSMVGVSRGETEYILDQMIAAKAGSAVIVLHSNEFVRTQRLDHNLPPNVRRLAVKRLMALCKWTQTRKGQFVTRSVDESVPVDEGLKRLPASGLPRTAIRMVEQLISRWY